MRLVIFNAAVLGFSLRSLLDAAGDRHGALVALWLLCATINAIAVAISISVAGRRA